MTAQTAPHIWTPAAKEACRERCAEYGEPPCWEVDQQPESEGDPSRGMICGECRKEANFSGAA